MKNTDTFSIKRVGYLLKNDLITEYRNLLISTLAIAAGYYMIMISSTTEIDYYIFFDIMFMMFNLTTSILIHIALAGMFTCFNSKERRLAFLSLPATNGEKITSRAIYTIVKIVLLCFVSYILADTLRLLTQPLFTDYVPAWSAGKVISEFFTFPLLIGRIAGDILNTSWGSLFTWLHISTAIWTASAFILAGIVWERKAFLKCVATLFTLSIVWMIISVQFLCIPDLEYFLKDFTEETANIIMTTIIVAIFIFSLLNLLLTYRKFVRKQIINRPIF